MNDLQEQPLTIIMPEDIVYMPIVIHGTPFDNAPLVSYLSLALQINKEMEFLLSKEMAMRICLEYLSAPVILFALSFEDVAVVREATLTNVALNVDRHEDKLFKIESDIIETLTIHEELPFGFNKVSLPK